MKGGIILIIQEAQVCSLWFVNPLSPLDVVILMTGNVKEEKKNVLYIRERRMR